MVELKTSLESSNASTQLLLIPPRNGRF
uniref:Uncharacterized protein n=1 Tax=Arundo donax TaxID=35708 RepID=A0A0A9CB13_ARUDO